MNYTSNSSEKRESRHFTGREKVAVIKAHLVDRVRISELCDQHQIQVTQFYLWQKQLFENSDAAFGRKHTGQSAHGRKIEHLTKPS